MKHSTRLTLILSSIVSVCLLANLISYLAAGQISPVSVCVLTASCLVYVWLYFHQCRQTDLAECSICHCEYGCNDASNCLTFCADETVCNLCGKPFDEWDQEENLCIHSYVGYGSKFDTSIVDMHICCNCFDSLVERCVKNPIVGEYELSGDMQDPVSYDE